MEPLIRVEADDLSGLTMENELLRYEVTHLRARLHDAQREAARATKKANRNAGDGEAEAPASDVAPRKAPAGDAPAGAPTGAPAGDSARDDLVWLLQRLEGTPVSLVLRRRAGYRTLLERYLPDHR